MGKNHLDLVWLWGLCNGEDDGWHFPLLLQERDLHLTMGTNRLLVLETFGVVRVGV